MRKAITYAEVYADKVMSTDDRVENEITLLAK